MRPAIASIPSIFWGWDYEHFILGVGAAEFVALMIFFLRYHSAHKPVNNREEPQSQWAFLYVNVHSALVFTMAKQFFYSLGANKCLILLEASGSLKPALPGPSPEACVTGTWDFPGP